MGKKRINSIESMRVIAALIVVLVHFFSIQGYSKIILDQLGWLAVPFFFISSGYFLAIKASKGDNASIYISYSLRIFKLYIFWSLIYFLVPNINGLLSQGIITYYVNVFTTFFTSSFEHIFLIGIAYHKLYR